MTLPRSRYDQLMELGWKLSLSSSTLSSGNKKRCSEEGIHLFKQRGGERAPKQAFRPNDGFARRSTSSIFNLSTSGGR